MSNTADILAFITILVWPVVPLFWIPVHGFPRFFRKIEFMSYLVPLILWLPLAYFFSIHRDFLLRFRLELPLIARIAGLILFMAGTALHVWTGQLLGIKGLMGLPEISSKVHGRLTTEGPFSVVRHPTYLAHTMLFAGVFLITGVLAVSAVTLLDFIIINAVVIPLEDRELENRFGKEYGEYKKRVPAFLPRFFKGTRRPQ